MSSAPTGHLLALGNVIDLMVDALGDPSCPVRRALVLVDLYAYPDSSLNDVMGRLDLDKSTAFRDIDWLVDHGCLIKKASTDDAREVSLQVFGHARTYLENALSITNGPENLATILLSLINLSPEHKQTLREAKILISLTTYGKTDKNILTKALYNGPASTDARAIQNLVDEGLVESDGF